MKRPIQIAGIRRNSRQFVISWSSTGATRRPLSKSLKMVKRGIRYRKAIAKATNVSNESLTDLENVLQQFGILRGARNDILHYGAEFIAEGKGLVSNAWKAKAKPTEFPISADALMHMETDLRKIIAHLGPKSDRDQKTLDDTLHSPWRYKHPAPLKSETKKQELRPDRKRGPKLPRQPQSSQR
jgi:hypothetical protein